MKTQTKTTFTMLIIMFFIVYKPNAQTYYPIPFNYANWNEIFVMDQPSTITPYKNVIHNDTIINSIIYSKVYKISGSDTSIHNPSSNDYYAAIRNDIPNRKVYVYFKDSLQESLLYDFSKNEGETIHNFYHGMWLDYTISNIDSVLIQGSYRKQFHFSSSGEIWIEGIGSRDGLFYPKFPIPTCYCYWILGCVWHNDSLLYLNPDLLSACYPTKMDEIKLNNVEITLLPNPAWNKLTIALSDFKTPDELNLFIYNEQGQLLLQQNHYQNNTEIDISSLKQGFYIAKILLNDEKYFLKKFMVLK
jgi:hypothetical protein